MPKKSKNNKKKLVVIAGPSCSGKSWLIKQINSDNPSRFARRVQKKCEIKGNVFANHIRLTGLCNNLKKGKKLKYKKRLGRGGYIHFDFTGGQQKLKRKILCELIGCADQVIVINTVVNFEQWIEFNKLRKVQQPDHGSSTFVKWVLKLHANAPLSARECYTYACDRWQQYLETFHLKKCITVELRQSSFIDQVERDQLGFVNLTRLQEAWLKFRFRDLLAKVP